MLTKIISLTDEKTRDRCTFPSLLSTLATTTVVSGADLPAEQAIFQKIDSWLRANNKNSQELVIPIQSEKIIVSEPNSSPDSNEYAVSLPISNKSFSDIQAISSSIGGKEMLLDTGYYRADHNDPFQLAEELAQAYYELRQLSLSNPVAAKSLIEQIYQNNNEYIVANTPQNSPGPWSFGFVARAKQNVALLKEMYVTENPSANIDTPITSTIQKEVTELTNKIHELPTVHSEDYTYAHAPSTEELQADIVLSQQAFNQYLSSNTELSKQAMETLIQRNNGLIEYLNTIQSNSYVNRAITDEITQLSMENTLLHEKIDYCETILTLQVDPNDSASINNQSTTSDRSSILPYLSKDASLSDSQILNHISSLSATLGVSSALIGVGTFAAPFTTRLIQRIGHGIQNLMRLNLGIPKQSIAKSLPVKATQHVTSGAIAGIIIGAAKGALITSLVNTPITIPVGISIGLSLGCIAGSLGGLLGAKAYNRAIR